MNNKAEKLLTVLIPVSKNNHMLRKILHSLINQKEADGNWNILVVYDNNYKQNSEFIIDERIEYIYFDTYLTYQELINKGVENASGKWVALIDKEYVYFDDSVSQMHKLIKNAEKGKIELGYIWLLYSILRTDIEGNDKFDNELENAKRLALEEIRRDKEKYAIDNYKYQKFERSYLKVFGSMLNIEKQNGSLFLKTAFLEAGGYREADSPMENAFLMLRILNNYDVHISLRKYGVFISKDSVYTSVEQLMDATERWISYITKQKDICGNKSNREYVLYRYISTVIQRHRSFNLKIEDFQKYMSKSPSLLKYIAMFNLRGWKYNKKLKRENCHWDRILFKNQKE